jgi:hypothetical protein
VKTTSFAAQGTMVNPLQHLTQTCKRQMKITFAMKYTKIESEWETFYIKDLFKILKKIFPNRTYISVKPFMSSTWQKTLKLFDFDLLDQNILVSQFCAVLTKVKTLSIPSSDVKKAIKSFENDTQEFQREKIVQAKVPYL